MYCTAWRVFSIESKYGNRFTENGRKNVFNGLPHAVYLPAHTQFKLKGESDEVDFAFGYTKSQSEHVG